ncbi:MAG: S9 family peptidase [Anaerolineales bacterium]|nr:S9 family peptidase [Anaerolineales bacterium]
MSKRLRVTQAADLYDLRPVAGPSLSPDGRQAAYTVGWVEKASEKKFANIWLVDSNGRHNRQFTYGNQVDGLPEWSPDGRTLAFLSNRGNAEKPAQLYLIPVGGGEARPLTDIKGSIGQFSWSPDGRLLLCSVRLTDAEVLEREKDEGKKKLGIVARHIKRVHYKYDGAGFLPEERWHIWTVDARTGKAKQLTESPVFDEFSPRWSPDGQQIVFVSNRAEDPDFNPGGDDIYLMPAAGGELTRIEAPFGNKSQPVFSPDGQMIAYYGSLGRGDWWQHNHLWVVPADGSGPARSLTGAHDFYVGNASINDTGGGVTPAPLWSADGQRLYFPVSQHGNTTLHSISLAGDDLQTVLGDPGMMGAYGLDADRVVYWHSTFAGMGEIKAQKLVDGVANGSSRQLSRSNSDYFRRVMLGQMEEVWFKGPAGNDLQGWILKPPGFDPAKKYPSIMEIHGGPLGQYADAYMHEFEFLAANGYVVYFANPRGGYGYGEAHAKAIWNDHGGADYDDVMAWANYVKALPYIDEDRRGVTGGSYGGFMVNWIIGHTAEFRAAVTQRSISNRLSSYGSSDINWLREITFDDEPPWENLENYWRQSPLKHIANAKTPTLVIHSEQDLRCPIEQGEQIYVALKRLGVETEMVRFPDSPHGLSRMGRTDRRVVRLEHILRWFDRYLK